jgi:peptidoglycan/LPS O-acetylase OafA/YrhL
MHILLALAALAILVLATELLLRCFPSIARTVLHGDATERFAALDGLRGILALSVFLHHLLVAQAYSGGSPWQAPSSNFDNLLGRAAVALFFMISAYLFWGRVLRRNSRLDWVAFLRGRVLRLAPLFYLALAVLLFVVAVETGFVLRVPAGDLARQILRWASFTLLGSPDINGLAGTWTILSTVWTLPYEWYFYLALPFLALIYRGLGRAWLLYVVVAALALLDRDWVFCLFFVTGALAAEFGTALPRRPTALAAIAALVALPLFFHDIEGPIQALLLLPIFVASLQSRTLLQWRPLRFLGHISYSVYLLHNPLIHIAAGWVLGSANFAALGAPALYATAVGMGLALILLSTLTFVAVEKPFLHAGARRAPGGIADAAAPVHQEG